MSGPRSTMDWIARLETKLGRFAIPGLTRIIVGFNALVYGLWVLNPGYVDWLDLRPERILAGEVWRLVSYVFIPPLVGPLWLLFALLFLWMVGEHLEEAWGSFRLNLFYGLGMLGATVAAWFFGGGSTNAFLNMSLLFAFATVYPNYPVYLLFILPVQMKWVGLFSAGLVALAFAAGSLATKAAIAASFANYLIFFGGSFAAAARERREVAERRRRFEGAMPAAGPEPLHRCETCARTELSNPDLDFRVARDGREYCVEHLPARVPPPLAPPADAG